MEQRVLKQSFHFNSSNNAVGIPPCAAALINTNGQLQLDGELSSGRNQKQTQERKILEMQEMIRYLELKLIETERRSKKESAKEIKRLRRQLERQRQTEVVVPLTQREDRCAEEDRPLIINQGDRSERVMP